MSHKQILNLLLSKPGVQVVDEDTRVHYVYRLEHDKLVSYHYDITNKWVRDITVQPLNIFTGEYSYYSQALQLSLEGEYTDIPPESPMYISDRQIIELLLDYKPIKVLTEDTVCIARLQQEDDIIAYFTEEQYKNRMLLDYAYSHNERTTGNTPSADIKKLLKGNTLLMIERNGFTYNAAAFQFEGDNLIKYLLNKKTWVWEPAYSDIAAFFYSDNHYSKVIDRIDIPNTLIKEFKYSLTDKAILSRYVKTNILYFIYPDGLIRVKNGYAKHHDTIRLSTSDIIEVSTDIGIANKSSYEQLQYRLLFDYNIDVFNISEGRFFEGMDYFLHNQDNLHFIFYHYHGIQGYKKLSIASIAKQLNIPVCRADRRLKLFHGRLKHPRNYKTLQQGYVNIPGDFKTDYVAAPDKLQHLSIDKMRYVAGCIANIY